MSALSDNEFRRFREWLAATWGVDFGPDRRDILRARLDPVRRELGFESFSQLLFHLKYHPSRDSERERLLRHLTNNESYFFRETAQLDVLRQELLPGYAREMRQGERRVLRIMSAGCARGEEPYTLAMVVDDSPVALDDRVRITGTDVDVDALERARAGHFREHAFRRIPDDVKARYFRPDDDGYRIDERIRRAVRFSPANLVDADTWTGFEPQDVIFCRNVLIYFAEENVRRAVRILHSALAPGGYLFLGHSESLSRVPTPLEPVRRAGTVFYRKPGE